MAKSKEDTKKAPEKKAAPAQKVDFTKDSLITAFEKRYDYQAARIMLDEALLKAGLDKADKFAVDDVKKLIEVVTTIDERTTPIIEALNALIA